MTLLEEIYNLYSRYTTAQIVEAFGQYRREIEATKKEAEIDKKIEELTEKKATIRRKRDEM